VSHSHVKSGRAGHAAPDQHAFDRADDQPHFSPTIGIPHRSFTGLTVPTRSVKSLKVPL
jgi:hypothetical protein